MQDDNFSEKDSLKLINEMIGKAKKSYVTKGTASIVWGSVIMICSLVTWSQVHYKYNLGIDIWLLTIVALISQIFFSVKESRNRNFVSYEREPIAYSWMAFGISIFILTLYVSTHSQRGEGSSLFMMLYAIPTFITGGITKFKPMIFGGVFCWVAAVVSIYTAIETDLLLMAACGFFAWLIPGLILWDSYKKGKGANV